MLYSSLSSAAHLLSSFIIVHEGVQAHVLLNSPQRILSGEEQAPIPLPTHPAAACNLANPRDWMSYTQQCKTNGVPTPIDFPTPQNKTLVPYAFQPLPLGSIKPLGWLRDQLRLMADGLPGHEHDFYRLVRDNPWLGGSEEYSPLNEAFPYWFNGLVPLAYGANDERLKAQVLGAAEYIISHQQDDGWLGPETDVRRRNFWARYPMFLALAQLVEAGADMTQAGAIIPALHRFVDLMHSMLSNNYQGYVWHPGDEFDEQWGRSRAADLLLGLQWLYEKYPNGNEDKIYECMMYIYDKMYDWSYWFSEEAFIKTDLDLSPVDLTNSLFPYVHGVNAGQGLKASGAVRRLTRDDELLQSTRNGVNWTFKYHGTPSGGIIGDERLAGLSPVRGVELCSVVETMFSLSYLYHAVGDNAFADRCELAAYNALPVMVMPDWWAHQYIAQTNQPVSHELGRTPFWNVGPVGQTFGTEPNYPCCTVDFPQGYPKFVSASFVGYGDSGIAHALLGPGEVNTTTASGAKVKITCQTNYPFNHLLNYTIESDKPFDFSVRVPSWAILNQTTVSVNGQASGAVNPDKATGMHALQLGSGATTVAYELGAKIRVEPRANDTVAIYHGALLYAVSVFGDYSHRPPARYGAGSGAPPEARDWTITPRSPWALAIDPSTLRFEGLAGRDAESLPNPIWAEHAPPVAISAMVCEIEWEWTEGYAPNPPLQEERRCKGNPFLVGLTPYGAAKLHMAELPTVDLSGGSKALWQKHDV